MAKMNPEKKEERKQKIVSFLKREKRASTSQISGVLQYDYGYTQVLLEELLNSKKIIKEEETRATYWTLPRGKKR